MPTQRRSSGVLYRVAAVMGVCTVVLTAAFVGVFGLVTGHVTGAADRLPYYVVVLGLTFVATILVLEHHGSDGRTVFASAVVVAAATFGAVALAVEGVLVAVANPDLVVASRLVFYVFAAGMIATGLGYWGIRHWREFAPTGR
ncbi:MAG: hypothetical protein ABEJ42_00350 [Halobacteriaceae archaeon]